MTIKNIIFDLHGVLFDYSTTPEKTFVQRAPVVEILRRCKHLRLFACTNFAQDKVDVLFEEHPEVMQLFHAVVHSSLSGAKKPDPAMFEYIIQLYELQAAHTLFLDDQLANIEGARRAGLQTIHVQNDVDLADAFKINGIFSAREKIVQNIVAIAPIFCSVISSGYG